MQCTDLPPLSSVRSVSQLSSLVQAGQYMHEIESICVKLHIPLKDLFPKQLSDFAETGVNQQVQELRLQHFEQKREFRLRKVILEASGKGGAVRNKSQDIGGGRRYTQECSPSAFGHRPGVYSVSPSQIPDDRSVSFRDFPDMNSTEVSLQDRFKSKHERILQAQERALQLRLSEISSKINKLQEKESRFDHAKDELRTLEAEKQRKRDQRAAKIRQNLANKYQQLEAYERQEARRGLQMTPEPKSVLSRCSLNHACSRRCLREADPTDDEITQQIDLITKRLEEGAERASYRRTLKALSLAAKADQYRKARTRAGEGESSREREVRELAVKLKQQQDRSQRLRNERINAMLQKRAEAKQQRYAKKTSNSQDLREASPEPSNSVKNHPKRTSDPLKAEKATLKRKDVFENRLRERENQQEMKEGILWKHQQLAMSAERRSLERASQNQLLVKQDFQRQLQRERLRKSMEGKMKDVHNRYFRTLDP